MLNYERMKSGGEYLLVTCDNWFYGKDGQKYDGVWGLCRIIEAKEVLGLKPTSSANWYAQFGDGENAMIVAGCRIHYAQVCLKEPVGQNILKIK